MRMAMAAGVASAACAVAVVLLSERAEAGGSAALRPDLVALALQQDDVILTAEGGRRYLRLSTEIANHGHGPLEIFPGTASADCDGDGDPLNDRKAFQRIFGDNDGDGVFTRGTDQVLLKRFAGCSLFHAEHDHWHFEEFARYRLVKPKTGRVVASSEKVSFCVRDSINFDAGLPGSPGSIYYGSCTQDSITGLSVGWADYYGSTLPGQELDIRGLPDGRYCLRTEADPADRLRESNETNNGRSTLVRITGREVDDLGTTC
jgi:hypothetical protein